MQYMKMKRLITTFSSTLATLMAANFHGRFFRRRFAMGTVAMASMPMISTSRRTETTWSG